MSRLDPDILHRLIQINTQFYQTFASEFSATRQRLQPGVQSVITGLPPDADLLDLGCGNGELWRRLAARGHRGRYLGLDFSQGLLQEARRAASPTGGPAGQAAFLQADLTQPGWKAAVLGQTRSWEGQAYPGFGRALAFAVLHHIPGSSLRLDLLKEIHSLLAPGGLFIHSAWQFLASERLRGRIQGWETVGIRPEEVEQGDYLLDWRAGGQGTRYVHHFDLDELTGLAEAAGFQVLDSFYSDGEGGNLGLYQVWGRRGD
jgi:SAM-dependent methyltransferase